MSASIEALAMAGVDYQDTCHGVHIEEWEREDLAELPPPPHLLADEEKEEEEIWGKWKLKNMVSATEFAEYVIPKK
ncbi:hypothetical protein JCGZ_24023 [Jatropha curcas]|uniref:Uncharacterized protein n=1 Tax=Jatropha curcas TaxID=180498 RepID=A0A067LQH5_JATCU|nr:hypothetical protein JCGZ_24023 [Jatropha curcas]